MKQDPVKVIEALEQVMGYLWDDEMKHFCEENEVEINSQDSLDDWIKACEQNGWCDHIFYYLMILKNEYVLGDWEETKEDLMK